MGTYADFLAATILKEHASDEQLRRAFAYYQQ